MDCNRELEFTADFCFSCDRIVGKSMSLVGFALCLFSCTAVVSLLGPFFFSMLGSFLRRDMSYR